MATHHADPEFSSSLPLTVTSDSSLLHWRPESKKGKDPSIYTMKCLYSNRLDVGQTNCRNRGSEFLSAERGEERVGHGGSNILQNFGGGEEGGQWSRDMNYGGIAE